MGDSQDVEAHSLIMNKTPQKNLLNQVLEPVQSCLGWNVTAFQQLLLREQDVHEIALTLLPDLQKEGSLRSKNLHSLYMLTVGEHQLSNRRAMVCTTKFNIMKSLALCLSPAEAAADRRKSLLVVANLCIPIENKAVILLGDFLHDVLPALLTIIRDRLEESYLAIACLFNLSQLEDGKHLLMCYAALPSIVADTYTDYKDFNHPYSVLRILEKLLIDYIPFLAASTSVASVQSEAFRWSMGTLRHLATTHDNAIIVAMQTTIIALAMSALDLAVTSIPLYQWTRDSLPDACLMFLVNVAQHEDCLSSLSKTDYYTILQKIKGGGIHELRARTLSGVLCDNRQKENNH